MKGFGVSGFLDEPVWWLLILLQESLPQTLNPKPLQNADISLRRFFRAWVLSCRRLAAEGAIVALVVINDSRLFFGGFRVSGWCGFKVSELFRVRGDIRSLIAARP